MRPAAQAATAPRAMAPLLSLQSFSLSVGQRPLIDGFTAHVLSWHRIALIGPNGSGKSTLLRALAQNSEESYFTVAAGTVSGEAGAGSVLLVEQDALRWSSLLPGAECEEAELLDMTLEDALGMAAGSGDEAALEDMEGWRRLQVAAQELLGWDPAAYAGVPLGQLSPGCAVRAYLAVALSRSNIDVLLLDEPTNHLDLSSILWLQEALLASAKAVVMVSHDSDFLDVVANQLWDVNPTDHTVTVSGASYGAYQHAKEIAVQQQRAQHDAQQRRHKRLTAVADGLRSAAAAGARHEAKDNDKLQRDFRRDRAGRSGRKAKAIETLRDKGARVERVADRAPLRILLDFQGAGTDSSIVLGSAVLGYEGVPLQVAAVSLRIDFGERVAIVGANGAGKSTLLRTITGELPPVAGEARVGQQLHVGNLTQEHEALPREVSPREYISRLTGIKPFDAGVRLMQYGLAREQVTAPVGELNPGARARALLASFSLRKVNTLILDEPTNHLDAEAVEEVLGTLNDYRGTVIVVSHSRSFLRALQLSRVLLLSRDGLTEVESIDDLVDVSADAARALLAKLR